MAHTEPIHPPISDSAQALLAALLDTLVPASADARLPSAAEVGFLDHLKRFEPGYLTTLASVLRSLDRHFAQFDLAARVEQVARFAEDEPATFKALLQRVYDCYYQDARVRAAIGARAGAPFPQGNVVTPGDLELLEPVIRHSERHRFRQPGSSLSNDTERSGDADR